MTGSSVTFNQTFLDLDLFASDTYSSSSSPYETPSYGNGSYNESGHDFEQMSSLYKFKELYLPFHGYLSLAVCIFGIIANIANIIVLTRKEMVSATNAILTGLAAADILVMADYVPFAIHNYVQTGQSDGEMFSYGWAVFTLFHAHFSVVCHTISTWLTVLLAVWRFLAVSFPTESKTWCSMTAAGWSILSTYIAVPICCTPVYLSFTIIPENESHQTTIYRVDWSQIALQNNGLLKNINFWVFSVGTKLVPCILLTYLSLALIRVLVETEKRRQRLKQSSQAFPVAPSSQRQTQQTALESGDSQQQGTRERPSTSSSPSTGLGTNSIKKNSKSKPGQPQPSSGSSQSDRTTRMLLSVLLIFLTTEFPSGILVLLSGIIGERFFQNVYSPLGELLDILALINSAINFILYCTMSRLFRKTFTHLFCQCLDSPEASEIPDQVTRARNRATLNNACPKPTKIHQPPDGDMACGSPTNV